MRENFQQTLRVFSSIDVKMRNCPREEWERMNYQFNSRSKFPCLEVTLFSLFCGLIESAFKHSTQPQKSGKTSICPPHCYLHQLQILWSLLEKTFDRASRVHPCPRFSCPPSRKNSLVEPAVFILCSPCRQTALQYVQISTEASAPSPNNIPSKYALWRSLPNYRIS